MKPYPKYKDSGIEWLGKVPEGWEAIRSRNVINYKKGKNPSVLLENNVNNQYLPYLSMDYLRNNENEIYFVEKVKDTVIANDGDILLLWDGSNAGEFIVSKNGAVSSTMAKISPEKNLDKRFCFFLCKTIEPILRDHTIGMGIPHVNTNMLKNIVCPLPAKSEQTQIATFLDHQTSKIDELVKKNEKLIELLKEKRQAVISHAVTKGLDPKARMKDSGIDWIEEIPEGWQTMPLRRIGRVVNGGTPESSNAYYWDGDIVWVTPDDLGKNQSKYITESKRKLTDEGYKSCSTTIIPKNSLIISTRAPIGHFALSALEICFNQGCRGIVFQNNYNPSFYYYYFSSLKDVLNSYGQGSTFFELGADKLASFYVAIPSLQEQIQIVTYLDQKTARIDETIKKILSQIDKLKEYRQALISNVVTGKVSVTG